MKLCLKKTLKFPIIILFLILFACGLCYRFKEEKKIKKYEPTIKKYSAEYSLDVSLVKAVIKSESDYDANAVSSKGAVGLMQLTPSTYRYVLTLGGEDGKTEPADYERDMFMPENNVKAGCVYLRYLLNSFSTRTEALCAYNAGEGRVREWLLDSNFSDDGKTLKKIPYEETYAFVKKVLFYVRIY